MDRGSMKEVVAVDQGFAEIADAAVIGAANIAGEIDQDPPPAGLANSSLRKKRPRSTSSQAYKVKQERSQPTPPSDVNLPAGMQLSRQTLRDWVTEDLQGADITASTALAWVMRDVMWTQKQVLQALRMQHYLQLAHVDGSVLIGCLVAWACAATSNIQLGRVEEVGHVGKVLSNTVIRTNAFTAKAGVLLNTVPALQAVTVMDQVDAVDVIVMCFEKWRFLANIADWDDMKNVIDIKNGSMTRQAYVQEEYKSVVDDLTLLPPRAMVRELVHNLKGAHAASLPATVTTVELAIQIAGPLMEAYACISNITLPSTTVPATQQQAELEAYERMKSQVATKLSQVLQVLAEHLQGQ